MAQPRGKTTDPNGPQHQPGPDKPHPQPNQPNHDQPKPRPANERPMLQATLSDLLDTYHNQFGGAAYSGTEAQATRDWADAQLAAGAITQEQHDSFYASSHAMAQNYRKEQNFYDRINKVEAQLGQTPSGFVPPGWDSTAAAILAGHGPAPSAALIANYAGVGDWLAANPGAGADFSLSRQAAMNRNKDTGAAPTTPTTSEGAFQPFTNMTGTQTGVPGYPVTMYNSPAEGLLAAHTALASHYASAAAAGDFASATAAQQALAGHQSLAQDQGYAITLPDTFDAADLYRPQNQ